MANETAHCCAVLFLATRSRARFLRSSLLGLASESFRHGVSPARRVDRVFVRSGRETPPAEPHHHGDRRCASPGALVNCAKARLNWSLRWRRAEEHTAASGANETSALLYASSDRVTAGWEDAPGASPRKVK